MEEIEILSQHAECFGDSRPDSTGYNHGYTGDVNRYLIAELQKTLLHITLSFLTELSFETRRKGFSMPQRPSRDLITGITV
jgi:hypothetical protein